MTNITKNDFNALRLFLQNYKISKQDIDDLKSFIHNDAVDMENKKFGKKVSNWIGKVYLKSLNEGDKKTPDGGLELAAAIAAFYGFDK